MITQLNIGILPELDCRFISLADRSVYNPNLPIEQAQILITNPGFNYPRAFYYEPNQILTLNSNLLGYSDVNDVNKLACIPDGVYIIKMQICPIDQLYAEFYHMRTVCAENQLNKIRCSLNACDNTKKEFKELREKITDIDFYLDQSKAAAESCGSIKKSKEFYERAIKLINSVNSSCATC